MENGVVVPNLGFSLPEGAEVVVYVCMPASDARNDLGNTERQPVRQLMDSIAALPDENPGDTFSGADHDKILYGKP